MIAATLENAVTCLSNHHLADHRLVLPFAVSGPVRSVRIHHAQPHRSASPQPHAQRHAGDWVLVWISGDAAADDLGDGV